MKKLLVCALVLGLSSMASAALTMSITADDVAINPGDTVAAGQTIAVTLGTNAVAVGGTSLDFAMLTDAGENGGATVLNPMAWNNGLFVPTIQVNPHGTGGLQIVMAGGSVSFMSPAGNYLEAYFDVPAGASAVNVSWTGTFLDLAPAGFSLVVPEPMTIALLGLGGLFLRRRK